MSQIVLHPPAPGTTKWRTLITASKVPALLGVSRFKSQYSQWHEMAGNVEPDALDEDRMAWGHIAESSMALWWAHKNPGFALNPPRNGRTEIAFTNPGLPFPNLVTLDRRAYDRTKPVGDPLRFKILECKTTTKLGDWGRPGEPDSIPTDYTAQVMFQMGVSGIHHASVIVQGFGTPEIHELEFDPNLFDAMVERLTEIHHTILAGTPPELDDSVSTYETVRGLHPEITDEVVHIELERAIDLLDRVSEMEAATRAEREAKIWLADLMGNAKHAYCGDVRIASRQARSSSTKPFIVINKKADLSGA